MSQQAIAQKRKAATEALANGHLDQAIQLQLAAFNLSKNFQDLKQTTRLIIQNQDFHGGLTFLDVIADKFPNEKGWDLLEMRSLCLTRCERFADALPLLTELNELAPENVNYLDGLSEIHARLGNNCESRQAGTRALDLKDQQNPSPLLIDLTTVPLPVFQSKDTTKNIIAFSLFGEKELYQAGAVENAKAAQDLFPEWTCRFYLGPDIPRSVQKELQNFGAQIVSVHERSPSPYAGLFWRFKVCTDNQIDRYLIRDTDSLLSLREKHAVDEWTQSNKHFHGIRDFATHTELILAGLWGGVRSALPDLNKLIRHYLSAQNTSKFSDQLFLRQKVWSTFKTSCLIHDSRHVLETTSPFPDTAPFYTNAYVGQRFDVFKKNVS